MTQRERQILQCIEADPMISQQKLADQLGITRSSVGVHIYNLMRKGYIAGKGYVLRSGSYAAVVGGVNMDIGGLAYEPLVAADSNPGKITMSLGGVGRNIAHNMCLMGVDVRLLTAYGDEPGSRIDWRSFDAQGLSESALNTYHAPADGWYLDLPEDWGETLSVTAEGSGTEVSTTTFALGRGAERTEILRIYTFSGEKRETLAAKGGRILLSREGQTIYAAELVEGASSGLTEDSLRQRFHRISRVWTLAGN